MKKFIIVILIAVNFNVQAQKTIGSMGGYFQSNEGTILINTIGEPVITTGSNSTYQLTQGFHQVVITDLNIDIRNIPPQAVLNIFPNPTSDYINIEFSGYEQEEYYTYITDISGKVVFSSAHKTDDSNQMITLGHLANSTYVITLGNQKNEIVATAKIIVLH